MSNPHVVSVPVPSTTTPRQDAFAALNGPSILHHRVDVLLDIARNIVRSFSHEGGESRLVVPAGVSDGTALRALNEYFKKHAQSPRRSVAINADDIEFYEKHWSVSGRDFNTERRVSVEVVAEGTVDQNKFAAEYELSQRHLKPAPTIEQVLAAASYACKEQGADLFSKRYIRGADDRFVLYTDSSRGISLFWCNDDYHYVTNKMATSGVPVLRK